MFVNTDIFCSVCLWNWLKVITRKVLNITVPLSEPLLLDLSTIRENKPLGITEQAWSVSQLSFNHFFNQVKLKEMLLNQLFKKHIVGRVKGQHLFFYCNCYLYFFTFKTWQKVFTADLWIICKCKHWLGSIDLYIVFIWNNKNNGE